MTGPRPEERRLRLAALVAAAVHALAGLASGVWVLPGAPGVAFAERLAYLQDAGWGWRAAWLSWIPAGLSVLVLLVLAGRRLDGSRLAALAVGLTAAALTVDAFGDAGQAFLLPASASDFDAFLRTERWLAITGFVVANGLYSLAALLFSWAAARRGRRALLPTGLPLAASGLWLVVAGGLERYAWTPGAAVATVVLSVVWCWHVGYALAAPCPAHGPSTLSKSGRSAP